MRVPSSLHLAAAAATLASVTLGCGGAVSGPLAGSGDSGAPETSTHDDASSNDASPPLSSACPTALPATGTACTHENVQCEYGSAWWSVSCDSVVQCQSGVWTPFEPSYEPCSPEPGPNPASCPSNYAAVPQGECTMRGLTCVYPQGECACQVLLGGPVEIDGGTADWECVPGQGCPFPRPPLGSSCNGEGIDCTYEECSYGETCTNGLWEALEEGCAGAAGGEGAGGTGSAAAP